MIRTPDQRLRVFVSSTLQELAAERAAAQAAITRLRLTPVMFELGARPHPPRELYRAYLEQSHVFVGLYWEGYGWVAPDMEISGLEDEWVSGGDIPRLVYIKEPAPGREPRLAALLARIRDENSTSYHRFSTPEELSELLENDLAVMLTERFEAAGTGPDPNGTVGARAGAAGIGPLPLPSATIVGREVEIATLTELVTQSGTRLVTITGAGGSGKTRLALELADRVRHDVGWRVGFADLTGLRSADLVLPTIAASLGVRDAGDRPLIDTIAGVIRELPLLLIVDNFEHVIDAAVDLSALLEVAADLTVVVTSRQALHLRWEQEYPLLPLEVPDAEQEASVDAIASVAAVDLLVDRARRVQPQFRLTEENAAAVAAITRRLDGLPLALELAAARLRVLAPADLLARLEHRLDALTASSPDMPARHRTLREAISWSYDLLSEDEQTVFRRMAVFAGGAGLEAIEAVCAAGDIDAGRVLDIVASLVDKSLVVSARDLGQSRTRFYLLATIQEFALERLLALDDPDAAFDLHLAWYCGLAEQAWVRTWTSDMAAWMDVLELEHDNLRIAMDHGAGGGDIEQGLRIASQLWPFWDVRGHYRDGERRLASLMEMAPSKDCAAYGRALSAHGWLVALLGDFERAMALMDQGVALVRAHGEPRQLAWSLGEQGNVAFSLGRTDEADRLFGECLAIARELGDTFLTGFGLFGLAYVALLRGDIDGMESRLRESLDLTRFMTQPWGIAWAEFSLGVVSILRGDTHMAVRQMTESLDQRWSIRDARGVAESVQMLATLASAHGELEWSAHLHGAAEVQREANGLTILPFLRPMHDESVARLRAGLDETTLSDRWSLGRSTPLEKTVLEALSRRETVRADAPLQPPDAHPLAPKQMA